MTSGHTVTTHPSDEHVEVVVGGTTIAVTDRPVVLEETGLPARYYLPRDDVRMDLLRATSFHTTCPFKGEASYWSFDNGAEVLDGVVWSYEDPLPGAEAIRDMLSFYPDKVDLQVRTAS